MIGIYAEIAVLKAFYYYCSYNNKPAFIFFNIDWCNVNGNKTGESDIIMVHENIGIFLMETKSAADSKASRQLDRAQTELLELNSKEITRCMCAHCCKSEITLNELCF